MSAALCICTAARAQPSSISVGIELQRDRFRYHFSNPSNFDTPFLVPHFFEQRYSADQHLLVLRARYGAFDFEGAVTPRLSGTGSDYDTFFQPDGDVVVHGRTTDVTVRAWRVVQHVSLGSIWHAGYAFSHHQSKYPPSFSTTSHTNPPSVVSSFSPTRESTASDVFEVRLGLSRSMRPSPKWNIRVNVDLAPLTAARLTTYLPDKYPGQPIRFTASALSGSSDIAAAWRVGHLELIVSGRVGHTWGYSRRSSFGREEASMGIAAGWLR